MTFHLWMPSLRFLIENFIVNLNFVIILNLDEAQEEQDLYEHYRFVADKGQEPMRIDKFLITTAMCAYIAVQRNCSGNQAACGPRNYPLLQDRERLKQLNFRRCSACPQRVDLS